MKRKLMAIVLVAGLAALAGCNTMEGLGKDIEIVGEKLQKKAAK